MGGTDLLLISCSVLVIGGFLLSWSRYRFAGAVIQTLGFTVISAALVISLTDFIRMQVRTTTFLLLQCLWLAGGTGSLLLMRLNRHSLETLVQAFWPGSPPTTPEELAR
ncbi:MAG TPA: hypothetical protein PKO06_02015, partial [Candidatus Ozemobacteraceae bacterium]|nr:hypothetical protein [Candidatus Ozemobacteraceae bacterium]